VIEERRRSLEAMLTFILKNQVLKESHITVSWFTGK